MKNVHIVFSYDGSKFVGYQIQNEGRTVQEELMKAVEKINGEKTKIDASGRTDRGVHALEQNACFKTDRTMQEFEWLKALNGLLPDDIHIKSVVFEKEDFHPRFDVKRKTRRSAGFLLFHTNEYLSLRSGILCQGVWCIGLAIISNCLLRIRAVK